MLPTIISYLWVLAILFVGLLIFVGLWKFLWFNLKECDYAFRWHGLWRNSFYVAVGKENTDNCYGINIRYHANVSVLKIRRILDKSFALDIPVGIDFITFAQYVKTLDVNKYPSNRILLGIVDESQLTPLGLNEKEMSSFHQFKEQLLKVAF